MSSANGGRRGSYLEREFIGLDSEGRRRPGDEDEEQEQAPLDLQLGSWPELRQVILREHGGMACGLYSPADIPGHLYRRAGKQPDLLAADLEGRLGLHFDDADALLLYLDRLYAAHLRAQAASEGPDLVERQDCYLVCANDRSGRYSRYLAAPAEEHLGTFQLLNFILSLPSNATIVGFGLGWDYSQWLRDLPLKERSSLCHPELRAYLDAKGKRKYAFVRWNGFALDFCAGRLSIIRGRRRRTVWDVLRFFQSTYLSALEAWIPELPDDVRDFITRMKASREQLGDDLEAERRYSLQECQYLAEMMHRYRQEWTALGLKIRSFYGAGSLAAAILRKQKIRRHFPKDKQQPFEFRLAADAAYFGGRFENAVHGPVGLPVMEYDLTSAYPAAATRMPCLRHAHIRHVRSLKEAQQATWYLARIRWSLPADTIWGPLPVRTPAGYLCNPLSGEGWYWSPEIEVALLQAGSRQIQCLEAFTLEPGCNHWPLDFVPDYFAERLRLDREGSGRGLVYKFGLNALYGKFAQRVGSHPFQEFSYAGLITSLTRARLQWVAAQHPQSVIAMATDAVYAIDELPIASPQKELGGWEAKHHDAGFFLARAGILIPYEDGAKVKARGLDRDELRRSLPVFEERWRLDGENATIPVKTRRFVGLTSGCLRPELWNSWITYRTNINLTPAPKRTGGYRCPDTDLWRSRPPADARMPRANVGAAVAAALGRQEDVSWQLHSDEQPDHG